MARCIILYIMQRYVSISDVVSLRSIVLRTPLKLNCSLVEEGSTHFVKNRTSGTERAPTYNLDN